MVVSLVAVAMIDLRALKPCAVKPCLGDQPVDKVCFSLNGYAHVVRSPTPGKRDLASAALLSANLFFLGLRKTSGGNRLTSSSSQQPDDIKGIHL